MTEILSKIPVPPLPEILSEDLSKADNNCQLMEQLFTLTKTQQFNTFDATVNFSIPILGLEKDDLVIIILKEDDNEAIVDVNNFRKATSLSIYGQCYNFPIFYMYSKCCLFYDDNIPNLERICDGQIADILFYYANTQINQIDKLKEKYPVDCLLASREDLKIRNFKIISEKWPLNDNSYNSYDIQNFILDKKNNCPNYIVLSKIPGTILSKYDTGIIDYSLFFEMIYVNASFIKNFNRVFENDNNNVLIANVDFPRIYKLGNNYIYFNTPHMLFYSDVNLTKDFRYNKTPIVLTNLFTTNEKYLLDDVKPTLEWMKNNQDTIEDFMLDKLPRMYSNHIITEDQVDDILIRNAGVKIASFVA